MSTPISLLRIPGPCDLPTTCLAASAPGAIVAGSAFPLTTQNLLGAFSGDLVPTLVEGMAGSDEYLRVLSIRDPANLPAIRRTLGSIIDDARSLYDKTGEKSEEGFVQLRIGDADTKWSLNFEELESSLQPAALFAHDGTGQEVRLWRPSDHSDLWIRTGWVGRSAALSTGFAIGGSGACITGYRCEVNGPQNLRRIFGFSGPMTMAGAILKIAAMIYTSPSYDHDLFGPLLMAVDDGESREMVFDPANGRFAMPGLDMDAARSVIISSMERAKVNIQGRCLQSPALLFMMTGFEGSDPQYFLMNFSSPRQNPGFWSLDDVLAESFVRSALLAVQMDHEPYRTLQSTGVRLPEYVEGIAKRIAECDEQHRHPDDIPEIYTRWWEFLHDPENFDTFLDLECAFLILTTETGARVTSSLSNVEDIPAEWKRRIAENVLRKLSIPVREMASEARRPKTPLERMGFQVYSFHLSQASADEGAPDMPKALRDRAAAHRARQSLDRDVALAAYEQLGRRVPPGALNDVAVAAYYIYLLEMGRIAEAVVFLRYTHQLRLMASYALLNEDDYLSPVFASHDSEDERIVLVPDSKGGWVAEKKAYMEGHGGADPSSVVEGRGDELATIGWRVFELSYLYEGRAAPLIETIREIRSRDPRGTETEYIGYIEGVLNRELGRMAGIFKVLDRDLTSYSRANWDSKRSKAERLVEAIFACRRLLVEAGMDDLAAYFPSDDKDELRKSFIEMLTGMTSHLEGR